MTLKTFGFKINAQTPVLDDLKGFTCECCIWAVYGRKAAKRENQSEAQIRYRQYNNLDCPEKERVTSLTKV